MRIEPGTRVQMAYGPKQPSIAKGTVIGVYPRIDEMRAVVRWDSGGKSEPRFGDLEVIEERSA